MADSEALRLDQITLKFGGLTVLEQVSLTVAQGELLALIGPNGAGKTSILNCISGIYRITSGHIWFGSRDITDCQPHEVARLGIARTFQHAELFPDMTVLENILVGRHAAMRTNPFAEGLFLPSVRREEVSNREVVEEILDFVELERYRHKAVGSLPFGIQKIVGFARALAYQPKILLLDEPCAGLNREDREDLARYIMRIQHEKRLAMIWVEHDMQMVADLADRLYVLDYGQVLAHGDTHKVLNDPRVIEAYIGHTAPSRVLLSVEREHQIQIDLLKEVAEAVSGGRDKAAIAEILGQLADYSRAHFTSEELLMRLYSYPDLETHALDHARMMDSLDEMTAACVGEEYESMVRMTSELEDFLLQHIATRDKKFSREAVAKPAPELTRPHTQR